MDYQAKDYGTALRDYLTAVGEFGKAWENLRSLLPSATGAEAEAVALMDAAYAKEKKEMVELAKASIKNLIDQQAGR